MSDWWTDRPWRLIQTNLREIDMRDIDAQRIVADLQSFKANVVMINAAGIIASYPTKLPFHFQSPYLTGDSLATVIEACHSADIRVIARTDFSKVRRPLHEEHPEWAYRTRSGDIVDYNGDVHVCLNGDYQQDYALRIIEEVLTTHAFDGIFFNMGGYITSDYSGNYYGPCHCDNCRRLFSDMFNEAIPEGEDMADPVFRKYQQFRQRTQVEHRKTVCDLIERIRPDVCIARALHTRRGFIRQESNTAIDRPLPRWPYDAADNTNWATTNYPDMVSSNTTVDFIDYPYRHVAVSPHLQKLRLALNLAHGGALDYYLIGRLDNHEDRTGFAPVREMFHYHAKHEAIYQRTTSCANIALLRGGGGDTREFRGWFAALAQGHLLFDVMLSDRAANLPWDRYELIILPDAQAMDDELAAKIDRFVERGGKVIATGRSDLCDAAHEPRDTPALQCLGINDVTGVMHDTRSTYFKLREADKRGLPRFGDCELIYMDGPYVEARYVAGATTMLSRIPPHNFGPPERCYYDTVTAEPGLVIQAQGEGRAIYLPWLPGALWYRQGHPNTLDFMLDVVERIAGVEPVDGNLSPQVHVTLRKAADDDRHLLHLVNMAGHFGNTFFEPPPLRDVNLRLPWPRRPQRVMSLADDADRAFAWSDGALTIEVPALALLEALVIS